MDNKLIILNNKKRYKSMKKQIIIFAICIITMLPAMAEQTEAPQLPQATTEQKEKPQFEGYQRNIFVGLLGANFFIGANYDMRINPGRMDGIGFRVGIGGLIASAIREGKETTAGIVTFPLEFNHVLGKRRHSFVSGVGLLPVYLSGEQTNIKDNSLVFRESGFGIAGYCVLGYRWQPLGDGIIFQINWNPLVGPGGFAPMWFGLGIGVSFKT
jgi:hypothetical protein